MIRYLFLKKCIYKATFLVMYVSQYDKLRVNPFMHSTLHKIKSFPVTFAK